MVLYEAVELLFEVFKIKQLLDSGILNAANAFLEVDHYFHNDEVNFGLPNPLNMFYLGSLLTLQTLVRKLLQLADLAADLFDDRHFVSLLLLHLLFFFYLQELYLPSQVPYLDHVLFELYQKLKQLARPTSLVLAQILKSFNTDASTYLQSVDVTVNRTLGQIDLGSIFYDSFGRLLKGLLVPKKGQGPMDESCRHQHAQ